MPNHEKLTAEKLAVEKQRMLEKHLRQRGISCQRILAAMSKVPRENFVATEDAALAYTDQALPIDCQQTISQPYIVAIMTQALKLSGNQRVLEIGTGSGYQTAILCELAGEVVSVERHATLSDQAATRIAALNYTNLKLIVDDGSKGCETEAPFDKIIITAAAPHIPKVLWEQLAEGGIMVIPLGGLRNQELYAIEKVQGKPKKTFLSACRFVPLIGDAAWSEEA